MGKSVIDLWANFLFHEKLDPDQMDEENILVVIYLCEQLAKIRPPKFRDYKKRLETRKLVCKTAIDCGIDLPAIEHKNRGRSLIGRGLLDAWNKVYKERFGSIIGTHAEWEAKRRDIKILLAARRRKELNERPGTV